MISTFACVCVGILLVLVNQHHLSFGGVHPFSGLWVVMSQREGVVAAAAVPVPIWWYWWNEGSAGGRACAIRRWWRPPWPGQMVAEENCFAGFPSTMQCAAGFEQDLWRMWKHLDCCLANEVDYGNFPDWKWVWRFREFFGKGFPPKLIELRNGSFLLFFSC